MSANEFNFDFDEPEQYPPKPKQIPKQILRQDWAELIKKGAEPRSQDDSGYNPEYISRNEFRATPPRNEFRATKWIVPLLAAAAVFFFVLWVRTLLPPGPGPGPGPDPMPGDRKVVAMFYDDEEMQTYTLEQREVLQSAALTAYLEEHADDWKRIDVDDDISGLPKIFQDLAGQHRSKLPWLMVRTSNQFKSEPIDTADGVLKTLRSTLEKR